MRSRWMPPTAARSGTCRDVSSKDRRTSMATGRRNCSRRLPTENWCRPAGRSNWSEASSGNRPLGSPSRTPPGAWPTCRVSGPPGLRRHRRACSRCCCEASRVRRSSSRRGKRASRGASPCRPCASEPTGKSKRSGGWKICRTRANSPRWTATPMRPTLRHWCRLQLAANETVAVTGHHVRPRIVENRPLGTDVSMPIAARLRSGHGLCVVVEGPGQQVFAISPPRQPGSSRSWLGSVRVAGCATVRAPSGCWRRTWTGTARARWSLRIRRAKATRGWWPTAATERSLWEKAFPQTPVPCRSGTSGR